MMIILRAGHKKITEWKSVENQLTKVPVRCLMQMMLETGLYSESKQVLDPRISVKINLLSKETLLWFIIMQFALCWMQELI
jgi:hypothetical protein